MSKIKYLVLAGLASLVVLATAPAMAQFKPTPANPQISTPKVYLSAATTNSNLVRAGRTKLNQLAVTNSAGAAYYLKLYDKATAPTCGTDTPVATLGIAAGGAVIGSVPSLGFQNGLGFCITGAIANNDTTAAATGVAVTFGYAPF